MFSLPTPSGGYDPGVRKFTSVAIAWSTVSGVTSTVVLRTIMPEAAAHASAPIAEVWAARIACRYSSTRYR